MKRISVLVMLLLSMIAAPIQVNASSTGIIGPSIIHKEQNAILTIADILTFFHSNLGVIQVYDDQYTGKGNLLGEHSITLFSANSQTQDTKQVIVRVVPSIGNVLAVTDNKNIFLRTDQVLSPGQIVAVLEKTGYIEITSTTQMMLISNTYTQNATTPGQYFFEFRLVNAAGVNQVYSSIITVLNEENPFIPDLIFEAPPSWWQIFWRWIEPFVYLGVVIFAGYKYVKYKKSRKKEYT